MKEKSKFVTLISIAGAIPILVAVSEVGRTLGSEFCGPSILSSIFLGVLGLFVFLSISEEVEFFEYSEKIMLWITLIVLILTAIVVGGTSI